MNRQELCASDGNLAAALVSGVLSTASRLGECVKRPGPTKIISSGEFMRLPPRTWQREISRFRCASTGWIPLLLWLLIFGPARASGQNDNIMELGPEALRNVQVYSASMYLQ